MPADDAQSNKMQSAKQLLEALTTKDTAGYDQQYNLYWSAPNLVKTADDLKAFADANKIAFLFKANNFTVSQFLTHYQRIKVGFFFTPNVPIELSENAGIDYSVDFITTKIKSNPNGRTAQAMLALLNEGGPKIRVSVTASGHSSTSSATTQAIRDVIIRSATDFSHLMNDTSLDRSERDRVFMQAKNDLPSIIHTARDLGLVLRDLSVRQARLVLLSLGDRLNALIRERDARINLGASLPGEIADQVIYIGQRYFLQLAEQEDYGSGLADNMSQYINVNKPEHLDLFIKQFNQIMKSDADARWIQSLERNRDRKVALPDLWKQVELKVYSRDSATVRAARMMAAKAIIRREFESVMDDVGENLFADTMKDIANIRVRLIDGDGQGISITESITDVLVLLDASKNLLNASELHQLLENIYGIDADNTNLVDLAMRDGTLAESTQAKLLHAVQEIVADYKASGGTDVRIIASSEQAKPEAKDAEIARDDINPTTDDDRYKL